MFSKKAGSGFTLLELLVVLVIVGILATITIPNYSRLVERTKLHDVESSLALFYQAERMYRLDNNTYGTDANLIAGRYLPDPDAGNQNKDWNFTVTIPAPPATTFTATATRTQPGGAYNNGTVSVDQTFNGSTYTCGSPYTASCFP